MQVISINGNKYTGPGSWGKLSTALLLQYALVLECISLSEKQAKHQLVMRLFKIPYKIFKILPESYKIQLHICIDWLYEPNTLSNWLIKSVRVGKYILYGPDDRLANITGEEFMFCEASYEKWLQTDDPELMDTLFGVLYRKRRFFGLKRVDFDREKLEKAEIQAKRVREHVKHAVMINYAGCRNLMIDCHPHIWKKASYNHERSEGSLITSWAGLLLELAGDKFGSYPETIKTNIWLLLADMDKKAENAEGVNR
jgi:hypothetical protein